MGDIFSDDEDLGWDEDLKRDQTNTRQKPSMATEIRDFSQDIVTSLFTVVFPASRATFQGRIQKTHGVKDD